MGTNIVRAQAYSKVPCTHGF